MKHEAAMMMMVIASMVGLLSCRAGEQANSNHAPYLQGRPYEGPPFTVEIQKVEGDPVQHIAVVDVVTPTGGWEMKIDKGEVINGIAHVSITLERPAAGEMVTQALVKHRQRFISMGDPFDKAWVYVFVAERGISYLTPDYRIATVAGNRN